MLDITIEVIQCVYGHEPQKRYVNFASTTTDFIFYPFLPLVQIWVLRPPRYEEWPVNS